MTLFMARFKKDVTTKGKNITVNKNEIKVFSKSKIQDVPWKSNKIDVVIDATGTNANLKSAKKVLRSGVKKVIVTHSPKKHVDFTMILGVNEKKYNYDNHHIISSSICDASAVGPILSQIEKKWSIESGSITTLHSGLSYQNLLDGPLQSVSSPGTSVERLFSRKK